MEMVSLVASIEAVTSRAVWRGSRTAKVRTVNSPGATTPVGTRRPAAGGTRQLPRGERASAEEQRENNIPRLSLHLCIIPETKSFYLYTSNSISSHDRSVCICAIDSREAIT